jgi:hypothetical protein
MNNNLFDIVICVGPFDNEIVKKNVEFSKKNVIGHRNIYLICHDSSINIEGAITIDEKIFPFNIDSVKSIIGNPSNSGKPRSGWYLQQLLKLYAGKIIPSILETYLVIDCDTLFLKPTQFITDDGKYILTTGTEYHIPYFIHMNKLHPSLKKIYPLSGISHHTLFNTNLVSSLMQMVEKYHDNKKSFWQLYLDFITPENYSLSGAAENETYFTYLYLYHFDKIKIRQLNWTNTSQMILNRNYDFISIHWYMRK